MVPGAGLEPARCYHRGILSPLRLPISPPGHMEWAFLCSDAVYGASPEGSVSIHDEPIKWEYLLEVTTVKFLLTLL